LPGSSGDATFAGNAAAAATSAGTVAAAAAKQVLSRAVGGVRGGVTRFVDGVNAHAERLKTIRARYYGGNDSGSTAGVSVSVSAAATAAHKKDDDVTIPANTAGGDDDNDVDVDTDEDGDDDGDGNVEWQARAIELMRKTPEACEAECAADDGPPLFAVGYSMGK
jgi:hypothetical protein